MSGIKCCENPFHKYDCFCHPFNEKVEEDYREFLAQLTLETDAKLALEINDMIDKINSRTSMWEFGSKRHSV